MKYKSLLKKLFCSAFLLLIGNLAFSQFTVGTIPKGDSIIIRHDVTIIASPPSGTNHIAAQWTIMGSNFTSFVSDDPKTGTPFDSTFTVFVPCPTISLTSATGTDAQILCLTASIGNITYNTTGATDAIFTGLPPGVTGNFSSNTVTISGTPMSSGLFNYEIELTGASCNGIMAIGSIKVNPEITSLNTTLVNVLCNGGATGSIDLTVNGGTAAYAYTWSNSAITQNISGLVAGTYTVTVTDANMCPKTTMVTITEPTDITLSSTQINESCYGGSTASIDLTVSGGTPGYTYVWSNSAVTQDISTLATGTYTVTVKDANMCPKTTMVTITEPTDITLSSTQINESCYGGSTGSIDLTVSGGTPGYTYVWSNSAVTQDIGTLSAITYTVTVKDANMCPKITMVTITEPTDITLNSTQINESCYGGSTGSIDLTVSGGTPGYTYVWSNSAVTQDIGTLSAITYTVTVKDANMCPKITMVSITEPTDITLSTTQVNVMCDLMSNASINLTVSGGTTGYTYLWSTNATTEDISGLGSGTYTVMVKDANLCEKSTSATIISPLPTDCFTSAIGNMSNSTLYPSGFTPIDPCTCNNDASTAQDDGTFQEFVVVTGPSGATITGTVTDGTPFILSFTGVPIPLSNPPMSDYTSNIFTHVDNVGYTATLFANTGAGPFSIPGVSNKCAYPNVVVDAIGPFYNQPGQANVPLTAMITSSVNGTSTWSGPGVTGNNFNPSGLSIGPKDITLSYDGIFESNISPDGTTAALPGCTQPATSTVIIQDAGSISCLGQHNISVVAVARLMP
ncbi:MAG: SprB repeat-containing protein [Saprospiraceae bacterium]|nr:SprB repeat-containing protein [Saprospiraceae bacterium]